MRDILIVEDGLNERERLTRLFASAGYVVSSAESVQEAESLLSIDKFRLAIIDIGLGDKSGSYLFELLKRSVKVPFIIILTGNPSTHLKQRFLDDGAVGYIVKGSAAASNEALQDLILSLLGVAAVEKQGGIALTDFIRSYLNQASRQFFLDANNELPNCSKCGSTQYLVTFSHKTQLPPLIEGKVICSSCLKELDPEVG